MEQNIVNWSTVFQNQEQKNYLKSKGCSTEYIDMLTMKEKKLEELKNLTSTYEAQMRNAKKDERETFATKYWAHLDRVEELRIEIEKSPLGEFREHLKARGYLKLLDKIKKELLNGTAKDGVITLSDIKAVLKEKMGWVLE